MNSSEASREEPEKNGKKRLKGKREGEGEGEGCYLATGLIAMLLFSLSDFHLLRLNTAGNSP